MGHVFSYPIPVAGSVDCNPIYSGVEFMFYCHSFPKILSPLIIEERISGILEKYPHTYTSI